MIYTPEEERPNYDQHVQAAKEKAAARTERRRREEERRAKARAKQENKRKLARNISVNEFSFDI